MSDEPEQSLDEPAQDEAQPQVEEVRSRPLFRVIGIILIALAVLLGVYGTVAYLAWQRSQDLQAQNARAALLEEIDKQLAFAREDVAAGKLALAQRRIEWILQREPDHPETLAVKQDIEQRLAAPTPTPRPTPTEAVQVEEEIPVDDELVQAFARLESLMKRQLWSEAVSTIILFQSEQPNYRRLDTDRLLYNAYINLGQSLLDGEQVELGLSYLAMAEALGDLPQEIEDQRLWAELYLQGIAYYGVDWGTTAVFFRDLCAAAPFYQDSCQKLRVALIAIGDGYGANLDWCPAESQYVEANQLGRDETLSGKLANARQMCLEATPTPSAPITGTLGISGTLPITSTEPGGEDDEGRQNGDG